MLKNYIVTILRGIKRNKLFTIINLTGLSVAMACFILVGLYVRYELSYDQFHDRVEDIFIVELRYKKEKGGFLNPFVPAVMAKSIKSSVPKVEQVTVTASGAGTIYVVKNNQEFIEEKYYQVQNSFFDVFTFPFLYGNATQVLSNPNSVVISSVMAIKYFGATDVVGKVLSIDKKGDFIVTGVLNPFPANSQFQPHFLLDFESQVSPDRINAWGLNSYFVYLKVKHNTDIEQLESQLWDIYKSNTSDDSSFDGVGLEPFTETYWSRNASGLNNRSRGLGADKNVIYVCSGLAILLLFIALANYVNMATAKAIERTKEVGVRKVNGASRGQLIIQFLVETLFFAFLSLLGAIILVELTLPSVSEVLGIQLLVDYRDVTDMLVLFGYAILCGLLAGVYPALLLSGSNPVKALKGKKEFGTSRFSHREILLFLQFTISSTLIVVLLVTNTQIKYFLNFDLGFEKAQVVSIGTPSSMRENSGVVLEKVGRLKGVKSIGIGPLPWYDGSFRKVMFKESEVKNVSKLHVNHEFLPLMEIELNSGRNFDANRLSDFDNTIIINKVLARKLGIENPVGTTIDMSGLKKEIIGVTEDFYFNGAVSNVKPLILYPSKNSFSRFLIKIHPTDMNETLDQIKVIWSQYDKRNYFKPEFLDDAYAKKFENLHRTTLIINGVTVAIVSISLFGLFSMVVFQTSQKVKEIGIRKVLGASVGQILMILSKSYVWIIIISTLVAIPTAYYLMEGTLNRFPNRISLDSSFGLITILFVVLFSFLIVLSRGIAASRRNPVDVLRNE